jgi:trimeric autotransporter adhesin
MAIQGFFTGDVKIRDLNGVLKAVNGIVEVATDAGTVTSVGLTVGSTGTDVNVANSPITTSGSITLNLPTASATNRGLLSSADWAIFSAKQGTITLTTTGNNGSATLISGTLNIPTYTLAGLGGISLTSLSASSPLLYNNTTGAFSIQVANGSQNGYLSSSDWTTFNSKQGALTFSSPLVNTSGTISIPAASGSVNGYLTSTDWTTFNNKQGAITLTTTGSSGASTLVGATLNIPTYTLSGLGGVPTSRQLTINGTAYDLSADRSWSVGTVTSVGLTMPSAFAVSSSPVTGSGTISVTGAGNATQYIRGDGALATFPTNGGGGGASVSYYLNGSVNQGTFGGNTYYEMNKTPIIGAGTDFTINADGYIAQFITDANDPALLKIPAGNWNFETYFQASSGGGSPTFYIELYKYNGTTFTLIASNSTNPKLINDGTNIEAYFSALAVPETVLTLTDRIAIRIYVTHSGRTITLHTENSHLCQVITTFTTGLAALNGLTEQVQYLATGTSGTDFNIASATATHTFNLPTASATNRGALSSADWTTFNSKQPAGSYITALTGEATASGPGSATVTLSTSAVTGKLLTGLNLTGGGSIAATDSILQAFGKVQNQISGMVGGVTFQGTWNAFTNTPTLTSSVGTKGYYYIVDVAGSTNLNGITDWKIGDWAIFNGTTWDKVDNTDAVSSVNGFTGAVSLTTSNIAEGTNLYYLDSRARLALSFTAGSGAYDNTTGVITIPTNTSQLTNGANYITLSSLSASSPLSYNSGTGAFSIQVANGSQNGYLSSSDWTTFNSKQNALTNPVTGTGTTNYLSKFTGTSTIGNSLVYDNGTNVIIGNGSTDIQGRLQVTTSSGGILINSDNSNFALLFRNTASSNKLWDISTVNNDLAFNEGGVGTRLYMQAGGNIGIGTITPTFLLDVNGTLRASADVIGTNNVAVFHNTNTTTAGTPVIALSTASTGPDAPADIRLSGTNTKGIRIYASDSTLTSTPLGAGFQMFSVSSTNFPGQMFFDSGANNNAFIAFRTAVTSGTISERMRITANGNISIGNTNDTFKLDVSGTLRATGAATFSNLAGTGTRMVVADANGLLSTQAIGSGAITGSGTTNYIPKFTGTSAIGNSQIFDNGTNVGIGTTSPTQAKFVIEGSSTTESRVINTGSTGQAAMWVRNNATNEAGVGIYGSSTSAYGSIGSGESFFYATTPLSIVSDSVSGIIKFSTAGATERMRISSGGGLSIGTTTAASTNGLLVAGNIATTGSAYFVTSTSLAMQLNGSVANDFQLNGGGPFRVVNQAYNAVLLGIENTGAATFSSSVTSNSNTNGQIAISPSTNTNAAAFVASNAGGGCYFGKNNSTGGAFTGTAYATVVYSGGDVPMSFYTNDAEKMRITSGGNVLIGTTSGSGKLVVRNTASGDCLQVLATSGGTGYYYAAGQSTGFAAYFVSTGEAGSITLSGSSTSYNTSSDYRLKQDLKEFNGLSLISEIKTYDYEWKTDHKRSYGVIAHELQAILPQAVTGEKDGERMQGVDYSKIVPLLVKAVQESHDIIKELKQKVEILESK